MSASSSYDYEATARSLTEYFNRMSGEQDKQHWIEGQNAASTWQSLLERGSPTKDELLELDEMMRGGTDGSAWVEFRRAYQQWRTELDT